MVNLIYQFWIKLESGNVGYQIRNPPASKVGTKNNRFTVISFSTSSSQTSQKWYIREVAIVTISICQFVLPTKQRTIKFLKFCRPVSCLLQTNNFRISKFTIALSSGVDGFSITSVHVKKRRKKTQGKVYCKAIKMPNFTSINQAWCWLWAILWLTSLALLVQLMRSLTFHPELRAFKTITSMNICKQCLRKHNVLRIANVDFLLNDSLVKSMRNSSHNPSSITTVLFKSTGTPVLHPFQHCKCLWQYLEKKKTKKKNTTRPVGYKKFILYLNSNN